MSYTRGELIKLVTMPATWIAAALTVTLPVGLAALNANFLRRMIESGRTADLPTTSTIDEGFGQLTYGLIGVVILGVVSISSEYARNARTVGSGRQVSATMTATPRRGRLLASKLAVLTFTVLLLAAITIPLTLWTSRSLLGPLAADATGGMAWRALWAGIYWVAIAVLSFTMAALTRNGIVPLVILITNSSLVSVSLLAVQVTDLARFLPDLAAYPSFLTDHPMQHPLSREAGLAVLGAWCAAALTLTAVTYVRRDA